ncbi:CD225/dispanin family protein [uncultured Muribaculum sp.]|uniref:CD225/dispanin family protein n=1 Tax=uncultured Muribaculum sp. TaxID=1918613 RepID=UPI0026013914|nr:CD225/dispanin family protein [uncultured Muribaculum sp.]
MKYYIIENESPVGPFELSELVARGLRPTDLVWAEGMADWATAESVEEVRMALYGPKSDVDVPSAPAVPAQGGVCPPPAPRAVQPAPEYQQQTSQQSPYQQQYQPQQPYQQPLVPPENYLVWAIIVTILCCVPFGIVAIVKAASVNGLWTSGNYEQAYQASASAKKWTLIAAICGLVVGLLYSGLMIFSGVMSNL